MKKYIKQKILELWEAMLNWLLRLIILEKKWSKLNQLIIIKNKKVTKKCLKQVLHYHFILANSETYKAK